MKKNIPCLLSIMYLFFIHTSVDAMKDLLPKEIWDTRVIDLGTVLTGSRKTIHFSGKNEFGLMTQDVEDFFTITPFLNKERLLYSSCNFRFKNEDIEEKDVIGCDYRVDWVKHFPILDNFFTSGDFSFDFTFCPLTEKNYDGVFTFIYNEASVGVCCINNKPKFENFWVKANAVNSFVYYNGDKYKKTENFGQVTIGKTKTIDASIHVRSANVRDLNIEWTSQKWAPDSKRAFRENIREKYSVRKNNREYFYPINVFIDTANQTVAIYDFQIDFIPPHTGRFKDTLIITSLETVECLELIVSGYGIPKPIIQICKDASDLNDFGNGIVFRRSHQSMDKSKKIVISGIDLRNDISYEYHSCQSGKETKKDYQPFKIKEEDDWSSKYGGTLTITFDSSNAKYGKNSGYILFTSNYFPKDSNLKLKEEKYLQLSATPVFLYLESEVLEKTKKNKINTTSFEDLEISITDRAINILNPKNILISHAQIYDITGILLNEFNINSKNTNLVMPSGNLSSATMVLVKVYDENGNISNFKILK